MKMTMKNRGSTTWPCLLPHKKIRCYRRKDPGTGTPQILHYCPPEKTDHLSSLPDSIQTTILNSLPIKESFRTSVLSKNWRHLCCSLPKFKFLPSQFPQSEIMNKVIDHLLRKYNAPTIDTLIIVLRDPVPHNQMDEWVSFAVSHHVQTFILWDTLTSEAMYKLPSSMFSCASLKVLRLSNIHIFFPTDKVFLPSLEFIELSGCCFTDAVFLTSNYPLLGKLVIYQCQFDGLSISSSALHFLMISISVGNPKINLLSIPNLSSISYVGYLEEDQQNISFETLSSLQKAYFVFRKFDFTSWGLVGKIVKGLCRVRDLEVGAFYVEYFRVNWGRLPVAPCFSTVHSLKLAYSGKKHVNVLKVLLRSYPNLEFLEMSPVLQTTEDDNNTSPYWDEKEKESLPPNFLNSLVTYKAQYTGKNEECELMKFIVENATALRNINICPRVGVDVTEEDVYQKLKTFSQKEVSHFNVVISRLSF